MNGEAKDALLEVVRAAHALVAPVVERAEVFELESAVNGGVAVDPAEHLAALQHSIGSLARALKVSLQVTGELILAD